MNSFSHFHLLVPFFVLTSWRTRISTLFPYSTLFRSRAASSLEPRLDIRPVHDVPDRLDIISLHVLIIQVEGVLPHIQLEQRDRGHRHTVLLIIEQIGRASCRERGWITVGQA